MICQCTDPKLTVTWREAWRRLTKSLTSISLCKALGEVEQMKWWASVQIWSQTLFHSLVSSLKAFLFLPLAFFSNATSTSVQLQCDSIPILHLHMVILTMSLSPEFHSFHKLICKSSWFNGIRQSTIHNWVAFMTRPLDKISVSIGITDICWTAKIYSSSSVMNFFCEWTAAF